MRWPDEWSFGGGCFVGWLVGDSVGLGWTANLVVAACVGVVCGFLYKGLVPRAGKRGGC